MEGAGWAPLDDGGEEGRLVPAGPEWRRRGPAQLYCRTETGGGRWRREGARPRLSRRRTSTEPSSARRPARRWLAGLGRAREGSHPRRRVHPLPTPSRACWTRDRVPPTAPLPGRYIHPPTARTALRTVPIGGLTHPSPPPRVLLYSPPPSAPNSGYIQQTHVRKAAPERTDTPTTLVSGVLTFFPPSPSPAVFLLLLPLLISRPLGASEANPPLNRTPRLLRRGPRSLNVMRGCQWTRPPVLPKLISGRHSLAVRQLELRHCGGGPHCVPHLAASSAPLCSICHPPQSVPLLGLCAPHFTP